MWTCITNTVLVNVYAYIVGVKCKLNKVISMLVTCHGLQLINVILVCHVK